MTAQIEIQDLYKSFKSPKKRNWAARKQVFAPDKIALHPTSFQVQQGEMIGFKCSRVSCIRRAGPPLSSDFAHCIRAFNCRIRLVPCSGRSRNCVTTYRLPTPLHSQRVDSCLSICHHACRIYQRHARGYPGRSSVLRMSASQT